MKVQLRAVVVDAVRFERPERLDHPPYPFRLSECGCDAMDGYTCGQHRQPPEYSYAVGSYPGRSIRIGEWVVWRPGKCEVLSDREFRERYEPAPSVAAVDPHVPSTGTLTTREK